tara:strand:- start:975 stop:1223 length:249 start_codon:yes stop_codon:yes gene_type:complete
MSKYAKDREFSHEVKMYIKFIYNDAGYWFYPEYARIPDNNVLAVQAVAERGPFPLNEDHMGIQAYRYLTVVSYIEEKHNHAS